jgi:hypothetical protein
VKTYGEEDDMEKEEEEGIEEEDEEECEELEEEEDWTIFGKEEGRGTFRPKFKALKKSEISAQAVRDCR